MRSVDDFIVNMSSEAEGCDRCDVCDCDDGNCHCNCDCNCNCDCDGGGCYCITDQQEGRCL